MLHNVLDLQGLARHVHPALLTLNRPSYTMLPTTFLPVMDSFPPELLENVLDNVTELRDLLTLRAVSKRLSGPSTTRAFWTMEFTNSPAGAARLVNVASSRVAIYILDLRLDMDVSPLTAESRGMYHQRESHNTTESWNKHILVRHPPTLKGLLAPLLASGSYPSTSRAHHITLHTA